MKFALIILASVNYPDGGVSVTSQPFENRSLCEMARAQVERQLKIRIHAGEVSAICVQTTTPTHTNKEDE